MDKAIQFGITVENPAKQSSDCVIVGVYSKNNLSESAAVVNKTSGDYITKILRKGDLPNQVGTTLILHALPGIEAERVLLVSCGEAKKLTLALFRKILSQTMLTLKKHHIANASCYLHELSVVDLSAEQKLRLIVETMTQADYQFTALKTKNKESNFQIKHFDIACEDSEENKKSLYQAELISQGMKRVRDLGNLPSNICTPTYLADQATALAKQNKQLRVNILAEKDMQKLGMGALLAVSQGSEEPGKLICMEYLPHKDAKTVVIVGKGVTFDSGGISIKPSASMEDMKYDMCGAASVIAVLAIAAELALPINVVGIVPTVENMPSGKAYKPGDIVTSMSGQTIEVINTDAEGRMILSDALTYAEKYSPDIVIDVATLTGAIIVALGQAMAGLFTEDDALADMLQKAGEQSADEVWRMPLKQIYQEGIDSYHADIMNSAGRDAGSVTAACFLSRFTKNYRWAHIDIAGTAYQRGKEKSATGRPVPLLIQFLLNYSESAYASS